MFLPSLVPRVFKLIDILISTALTFTNLSVADCSLVLKWYQWLYRVYSSALSGRKNVKIQMQKFLWVLGTQMMQHLSYRLLRLSSVTLQWAHKYFFNFLYKFFSLTKQNDSTLSLRQFVVHGRYLDDLGYSAQLIIDCLCSSNLACHKHFLTNHKNIARNWFDLSSKHEVSQKVHLVQRGSLRSPLRSAALVHTVLMHDHLLSTHTDTQKTYIARKWVGQKLRDEILQTA